MAASVLTAIAVPVAAAADMGPQAQRYTPVAHTDFLLHHQQPVPSPDSGKPRTATAWPSAGEADLTLPTVAARNLPDGGRARTQAAVAQKAGSLPITIAANPAGETPAGGDATTRSAHVKLTGQDEAHRAGVAGVLFSVAPTSAPGGAVSVGVDYSGFADAMGAGFGSRLHLVRLPACALTAPDKAECRSQESLASHNDAASKTVSADVAPQARLVGKSPTMSSAAAAPMVLAAVAGPGGPAGSFEASSLTPSGSWSVSGASGAFTWSYPIVLPQAATGGDVAPKVALSYSSASVDGRTAATNGQSSWVGQGWDYSPGFVERTYRSCAEDTTLPQAQQTGDRCWAGQILTMSLGGSTTALVRDDATGAWKAQRDNGARVELLTGAPNGANNGEYWKVTTSDGAQYFFGRHHLPGWVAGKDETNSTWTVPVYGPHPNDPCHNDVFASASCAQAWRWNLDYAVDPHGNATAYYYNAEANYYGANTGTTGAAYTRGGTLKRVDYGLRDTGSGIYGAAAPDQVTFDTVERCDPAINAAVTCDPSQFAVANAKSWPDTPADQQCAAADTCNNHAPTFWSTKRLTGITTWYNTGSGAVKIDNYQLAGTFPQIGNPELRLDSITRTGYNADGTSISLPPVQFTSQQLDNRVVGYNGLPALAHWRITNVATDTGGSINVTYTNDTGGTACTSSSVPSDPRQDDKLCFPVYWSPQYYTAPILDYFHKYVVSKVDIQDRNAVSPTQITTYNYLGKPAWHFDDNEIVKPANRTYGQFRGYAQVEVRNGNPDNSTAGTADARTLTRTTYFRGMDGDTLPNSGTRSAQVTDSLGETVPDNNLYADQARETQAFNGDGGPQLSTTITDPVTVAATATRARTGLPALTASITDVAKTRTVTNLTAGGTRTTTTTNAYDGAGRLTAKADSGDGVPDLCSTTSYADNTGSWIRNRASEVVTSQQKCPTDGSAPSPVLSDVRTYYDGQGTLGVISGAGDATRVDTATANTNGALTFNTTGATAYDTSGRVTSVTDALGHITTTAYTPTDGGILSQTVATNPKRQTATIQAEPARGKVTKAVDTGGHVTQAVYDALGRPTSVWKPGRTMGSVPASVTFEYLQRVDGPLAVTTHTLVDYGTGTNYVTSISLFDALGQVRQTQIDAVGGGRVVKDVVYDSHGWARISNNRYYTDGSPSTTMVSVADSAVDDRTITAYDGTGRAVTAAQYRGLNATWSTQTVYGGDRTTVIPPQGGVTQTTVTDAHGKTVELDQYTSAPTVNGSAVTGGAYQATRYHYTATGLPDRITDPDGNVWAYGYDFLGRKTSQTDPDAGNSTVTYDLAGETTSTTDSRGQTLAYTYDELGRKTNEYAGSTTGTLLANWKYDGAQNGVGKPWYSTRYTPQGTYNQAVSAYDGMGNAATVMTQIPSAETGLGGLYTTGFGYTTTGLLTQLTPAGAGALKGEAIGITYDKMGKPQASLGYNAIVSASTYTPYGEPSQFTLGPSNSQAWLTFNYDAQTRRPSGVNLSAQQVYAQIDDRQYSYDPAGNTTKVTDTQGSPANSAPVRTQCYGYDTLQRLTQAWTAVDSCAAAPNTAAGTTNVGGPNSYWTTWSFEPAGLRTQQTQHALPGAVGADTTTTYTYPQPGTPQAHTLTGTTTTGPVGTSAASYGYDQAGNTTTRTLSTGNQTLTWDVENHLATVAAPAGQSSYVYDADGGQLVRHDPGKTTLYLPGEEITRDSAGTVTGTRYYSHDGITVALRVGGDNPKILLTDAHGTGQVTADWWGSSANVIRRDTDPYGNLLGQVQNGPWPDVHGFLGKPQDDATGLTDVGARKYDPVTGRFISADPILNPATPQQFTGYAYANDNPLLLSDPSGLMPMESCMDGGGPCQHQAANGDYVQHGNPDEALAALAPAKPPKVKNEDLSGILEDSYARPGVDDVVGRGTVSDALRYELRAGLQVGGKWHFLKAAQQFGRVSDWLEGLRKGRFEASSDDELAAIAEAKDLWDALNSHDEKGSVMTEIRRLKKEGTGQFESYNNAIENAVQRSAVKDITGAEFEEVPYKAPRFKGATALGRGILGLNAAVFAVDGFQHGWKGAVLRAADPMGVLDNLPGCHEYCNVPG
ncbi:RHS repeat domain-containing protein [Solihabitans fulvus]|nr:RHS repeat-associated core domain-containing protein [Solihabitans fulvus]